MELKFFNTSNMKSAGRAGQPTLRVTRGGYIGLSKAAVDPMDFKAEDKVSLVQDQETPEDWYLVKDQENGFILRESSGSGSLAFNSSVMGKAMLDSLDCPDDSVRFKVVTEPVEHETEGGVIKLFPILTASAKPSEKPKKKKKDEPYEFTK